MNNNGENNGNRGTIDSIIERGATPQATTFRESIQGGVQPQRTTERGSGEKPPARD